MTKEATNKNKTDQEEEKDLRIIELFERRDNLTDDELQELAANPDMQDALLDLMDMGEAASASMATNESVTVPVFKEKKARSSYFKMAFAIAACAIALFAFCFWNIMNMPDSPQGEKTSVAKALPENTVFEQQDNSMGVTLSSASGNNVTPALQSIGTSVLADFTVLKNTEAQEVRMDVPAGYDATVTLPDGSIAYLHPGSRLKFPTKFVGENRQVILEGECYFKVKHDAAHPFIVEANDVLTTVLGTEFDVTTSGTGGTVVTLVNGSVRVNDANSDANMIIVPGQQVSLKSNKFIAKTVDTSVYEAWRDGFICYDNMPLSKVMEAIGRNYNLTVHFANREAMQIPVRFVCERGSSVEDALALINSLKRASVKLQNGTIFVE